MKSFSIAATIAALLWTSAAIGQGVINEEVQSYGSGVEEVGMGMFRRRQAPQWTMPQTTLPNVYPPATNESFYGLGGEIGMMLSQVPPDDGGKWHVLIFSSAGCSACAKLERDWNSSNYLRALASPDGSGWAHYNLYRDPRGSQASRYRAYGITSYPTVVLVTPSRADVYPKNTVVEKCNYTGDPKALALRLTTRIQQFARKYRPNGQPARPNDGQSAAPYQPAPYVQPPAPYTPSPIRPFSDFFGRDEERTDGRATAWPDTWSNAPEILLVTDPHGLQEYAKSKLANVAIRRLKSSYGVHTTVRQIDFDSDEARRYPIERWQTPCAIVSSNGRMVGFASAELFAAFAERNVYEDPIYQATAAASVLGWVVVVAVAFLFVRNVRRSRLAAADPHARPVPEDEKTLRDTLHDWRPSTMIGEALAEYTAQKEAARQAQRQAKRAAEEASEAAEKEAAAVKAAAAALDDDNQAVRETPATVAPPATEAK